MESSSSQKIILGIDPGTRIMGYGLIKAKGQKFSYLDMGILNLSKETDSLVKLERIHEEVSRIIEQFNPDCVSIETPFYGKNVQSLIKLGRAQGVAIAAAMTKGVQVYEYAPLKIKQSLTGNGNASKEQVCAMVFRVLGIEANQPRFLDATDAMAAAICHGIHCKFNEIAKDTASIPPKKSKKKANWVDFLNNHPERIM